MRRTITTLIFLVAVALLIAGVSLPMVPQWLTVPGGLLALLASALVGITQLGEGHLAWRDLLFGNKKTKEGPATTNQVVSGQSYLNIKADTYIEELNLEQKFSKRSDWIERSTHKAVEIAGQHIRQIQGIHVLVGSGRRVGRQLDND